MGEGKKRWVIKSSTTGEPPKMEGVTFPSFYYSRELAKQTATYLSTAQLRHFDVVEE